MDALRDEITRLPRPVAADLLVSATAYLLIMDLPGATAMDTDIEFNDDTIQLRAERRNRLPDDAIQLAHERPDAFEFTLTLPPDVAQDEGTARLDRGVLELWLPRTRPTSERSIPVTSD